MDFHKKIEYILQAINCTTNPDDKEKYYQKLEEALIQYVKENRQRPYPPKSERHF